jgi:hypothetical protein
MDRQPDLPGRCGICASAPRQAGPGRQRGNFRCPQMRRIKRPATGLWTEKPHPPWFRALAKLEMLAEYAKARARTVADVMTHQVVVVSPDASLDEIAGILESKAINRVPVVADGPSSAS